VRISAGAVHAQAAATVLGHESVKVWLHSAAASSHAQAPINAWDCDCRIASHVTPLPGVACISSSQLPASQVVVGSCTFLHSMWGRLTLQTHCHCCTVGMLVSSACLHGTGVECRQEHLDQCSCWPKTLHCDLQASNHTPPGGWHCQWSRIPDDSV